MTDSEEFQVFTPGERVWEAAHGERKIISGPKFYDGPGEEGIPHYIVYDGSARGGRRSVSVRNLEKYAVPDTWTPNVTVAYLNDEGDEVKITRTLTPKGVEAVLLAMDEHVAD